MNSGAREEGLPRLLCFLGVLLIFTIASLLYEFLKECIVEISFYIFGIGLGGVSLTFFVSFTFKYKQMEPFVSHFGSVFDKHEIG